MAHMYAIGQQWLTIADLLEESGGEITDDIQRMLDEHEVDFVDAAEQLIHLSKERAAMNNMIITEIKTLQTRKANGEKVLETLERNLEKLVETFGNIHTNGLKHLQAGIYDVKFRKSTQTFVKDNLIQFIFEYILNVLSDRCRDTDEPFGIDMESLVKITRDINESLMKVNPLLLKVGDRATDNITDGHPEIVPVYTQVVPEDLDNIKVNLSLTFPMSELLTAPATSDLFAVLRVMYNNTDVCSIKPSVNKTELKKVIEKQMLSIAKPIQNQTIQY